MPKDIDHHQIPEGWRWARLRELCRFVNGDAYKENDWSQKGIPIIRIQNLNDNSKPFNYWSGGLKDRVVVKPGNVLLAWSGTPGTSFGVHIWNRGTAVLNQHIFRVDFQSDELLADWAAIAINHQLHVLIGKAHGGVGLRHVTKGEVESLEIPLPPPQEQRRIAVILNEQMGAVERARAAAKAQLEAAKALPNAYLRAVFSSAEAQQWPRRRLGDFIASARNGFGRRPKGTEDGPIVLRLADVSGGFIDLNHPRRISMSADEVDAYHLNMGDALFLRVNGSRDLVGRCIFVDVDRDDLVFNDHLIRVRLSDALDTEYLKAVSSLPEVRFQIVEQASTSAGQLTINQDALGSLEIPVPALPDQHRITVLLNEQMASAERGRKAIEEELDVINKLPAAFLRRAFAGES